jgi:hypothetical protein
MKSPPEEQQRAPGTDGGAWGALANARGQRKQVGSDRVSRTATLAAGVRWRWFGSNNSSRGTTKGAGERRWCVGCTCLCSGASGERPSEPECFFGSRGALAVAWEQQQLPGNNSKRRGETVVRGVHWRMLWGYSSNWGAIVGAGEQLRMSVCMGGVWRSKAAAG